MAIKLKHFQLAKRDVLALSDGKNEEDRAWCWRGRLLSNAIRAQFVTLHKLPAIQQE